MEKKNKNNKGRNSNNRSRNNKNNRNKNVKSSSSANGQNRNRKRVRRRTSGGSDIFRKYDNLLSQHLISRKKYFEYYYRANDQLLSKLEDNFYKSLKQLRDFETGLSEEDRIKLKSKYEGRPIDTTYTANREITPEGEIVSIADVFEDPHHLETQRNHEWSNDTEESSGSYEEYKRYKGIE